MVEPMPRVSAIMSVYNAADYLREAIDSILNQSFTSFEFIIVDDCSSDGSAGIVESLSDPRIRLIRNDVNLGLAKSLNTALGLARGDYIARMDSDDVSLPRRLEKQVAFMDSHPEVGVSGTWIRYFGAGQAVLRLPTDHDTLAAAMIFGPHLVHPTVMMRRSLVEKYDLQYDAAFKRSQDYDLWWRVAPHTRLANLGEVLLNYRLHGDQARNAPGGEQQQFAGIVRRQVLQELGIEPTPQEMALHQALSACNIDGLDEPFARIDEWLCRLQDANRMRRLFSEKEFSHALIRQWLLFGKKSFDRGMWETSMLSHSAIVKKSGTGWHFVFFQLIRMALGR